MACSKCGRGSSEGFCPWCGGGSDRLPPTTKPPSDRLSTTGPRGFWPMFSRAIASAWDGFLDWISWARKELREASRVQEHGKINAALVCPHCQAKGSVRSKAIDRKTGISGGKIAAAVLLSPLTLLATGVSRSERATQAHCDCCESTWTF